MPNPFPFLAILFATFSCLVAGEPEEPRTCRILYLLAPPDSPKSLQLFDGESCREVELPQMNLSQVYPLRAGRITLSLLNEAVTGPKEVPEGSPSVDVPEDVRHVYLLIRHDPENKQIPLKMIMINANHDRLGLGEMLWMNLSDSVVSGSVGSQKIEIKPGEEILLKAPSAVKGDYAVELAFRADGENVTRPLSESRWRNDPRGCSIVFIVKDRDRIVPKVMTFSDYRESGDENSGK